MDIGSWLRSLGLEQYEALFRENDIDAPVGGLRPAVPALFAKLHLGKIPIERPQDARVAAAV